jgi:tight adherence protein C
MEVAVLISTVFAYLLFLSILISLSKDKLKIQKRVNSLALNQKQEYGEELSKPFSQRFIKPIFSGLSKVITRLAPHNASSTITRLEKDLRLAGMYIGAREFSGIKTAILLVCLGSSIVLIIFTSVPIIVKLMIFIFGLVLGVLIPRYYLQAKVKKRQEGIRLQMPDIMDLLSVSVEAGLGFDAALLRVGEKTKGPLIDELLIVYREIQMGKPRRDALRALSERSSVEELKTFTSAVVQAELLGISIKNVLRIQAQQLRVRRRQRAEEKAMKAPIKMMLPLVIFIFPVIFIILLGPSLVKIMHIFS